MSRCTRTNVQIVSKDIWVEIWVSSIVAKYLHSQEKVIGKLPSCKFKLIVTKNKYNILLTYYCSTDTKVIKYKNLNVSNFI